MQQRSEGKRIVGGTCKAIARARRATIPPIRERVGTIAMLVGAIYMML